MSPVCPAGHPTSATDYCDVCGAPVDATTGPGAAPSPAHPKDTVHPGQPCPNCGAVHGPDALFCESCGYDFTTGALPRPLDPPTLDPTSPDADLADAAKTGPAAAPRWVVEIWVDPAWYADQGSSDPLPSPGPPTTVVLDARSALVGRISTSRNIHPDVDCEQDSGVSRRHAQLTTDGARWWVEDLESANGTFVGPASGDLPQKPVTVGQRHELDRDDRVYLGAWTRLAVRPAAADED